MATRATENDVTRHTQLKISLKFFTLLATGLFYSVVVVATVVQMWLPITSEHSTSLVAVVTLLHTRGEQIMLKKLPIMLCCTAPKRHLLCSTNVPIMLRLCSLNCQESIIIDI